MSIEKNLLKRRISHKIHKDKTQTSETMEASISKDILAYLPSTAASHALMIEWNKLLDSTEYLGNIVVVTNNSVQISKKLSLLVGDKKDVLNRCKKRIFVLSPSELQELDSSIKPNPTFVSPFADDSILDENNAFACPSTGFISVVIFDGFCNIVELRILLKY